ncbi:response regulator [Lignipirellula cremea]|uniref:Translational regulator CsrA n=1 Tax=Lignipirellula cremea TaxID=2528010 RepID=A0A518DMP2_9BACT|nr:response regulator [Lignipirellula cremea]QDU93106.1 Transcriptional regulatory protein WalR [Lignipirellula cremea]
MLVLTRRENEKILFPSLGISVEILKARGSGVRLGISAPENVPIRRAELAGLKSLEFACDEESAVERLRQLTTAIQERLNAASFGLNQLHQRVEEGDLENTQAAIMEIYHELKALEREGKGDTDSGSRSSSSVSDTTVRRALVVEDDVNSSQLLAGYLRMHGFEVTTAPDGQDALDYLSMHSAPDVVLLDMFMPRCDGPTFVSRLRSDPEMAGIRIYGMSGAEPDSIGMEVGPRGVDRWFSKPLNPEMLIDEVRRSLDPHHAA